MKNELCKKIQDNLIALGINTGDSILVHSSLTALGGFPDKAQIVTEALLKAVGDGGTLLMPSLSFKTVTNEKPVFNVEKTPSCVGWLTEYFRLSPGVKRSLHPTHSVCAFGRYSGYFVEHHHLDNTPCGKNSPFRKLKDHNGKILFLGCSLNANTSMHGVEELSVPEYLFGEEVEYQLELMNGEVFKKKYLTHNFNGFRQCYDRVLNILSEDDFSFGKVLVADAYIIEANPLWEKSHMQLCDIPLYFVEKINQ